MRIGIDLDGVVFQTEMLWATYAELYDVRVLKRNSICSQEEPRVQERYDWSKDEVCAFFDQYANISDFDIVPGAKKVLALLRQDGHQLIAITARGNYSKRGIEVAEKKLKENGIQFDKYYYNQKEKITTCKKEQIDLMIDDNYHICKALEDEKLSVLYFHSLGRKVLPESDKLKTVTNWGEIYRYISEISSSISSS